jgi:MtN3 and saliva related transmembrane protein
MEWLQLHVEAIGSAAAVLTTVAFIPQVVRTWKIDGNELSWSMLTLFGLGVGLWFVYGYLKVSPPLMAANGVTGLLVLNILLIKVWRARRRSKLIQG